MREMEEVREYLLALTRGAHEASVTVGFGEFGEVKTPLIGKIVAWSLNYAVDVIDGCQIGFGQEDLQGAFDWIVKGAMLDTLLDTFGRDRDGR